MINVYEKLGYSDERFFIKLNFDLNVATAIFVLLSLANCYHFPDECSSDYCRYFYIVLVKICWNTIKKHTNYVKKRHNYVTWFLELTTIYISPRGY